MNRRETKMCDKIKIVNMPDDKTKIDTWEDSNE
nr:MAG TPA: hypothetical protein [Caudoviricetes sp.]